MRWIFLASIVFATTLAPAQSSSTRHSSAELLFLNSDSASALRASAFELRRNPRDVNALFARMEAARLQLRQAEELKSALRILALTDTADPRATLAADRVRELAANTTIFRSALPKLVQLLGRNTPYRRELSEAFLNAANDGLSIPTQVRLTRRLRHWQIAGPFGQLSEVDFDRSWAPEQDQLRSTRYGDHIRESVDSEAGELAFPDYFTASGIYYAASDFLIAAAGRYKFTIESEGTFVFNVDGKPLLVHDGRFHQQDAVSRIETEFAAGRHRVFVKLQLSASPLRVWIEMSPTGRGSLQTAENQQQKYLEAAVSFEDGAISSALFLGNKGSGVAETLKGDALSRAGLGEQAQASYKAAAELDSNDLLAQFHLASYAYDNQNFEAAVAYLTRILKDAPEYWPAQNLKYEIAEHFDWPREREEALAARLRLHPSCKVFTDASSIYQSHGNRERAQYYESKLAACSPAPYQYWEELSFHGNHAHALASISRYLTKHASDRRALTAGTREAVLAGNKIAARRYARALLVRAPNLPNVQTLARNPEGILDSRSAHSNPAQFYRQFVRDALPLMADTATRPSDSEVLINDRVVKLDSEGAWVHQHTVTQVFDKKGIETTGELELPHPSELLELRTIKRNGTFVEPEISDNKDSVSMPSLEEGDAVEISYLQHFSFDSLNSSPDLLDFILGSSDSPTRSAQLTIIRNSSTPEPVLWHSPEVRKIFSGQFNGAEVATWRARDLPSLPQEPDAPNWERRARVIFLFVGGGRQASPTARLRDELIQATRITPRIDQIAATLRQSGPRDRIAAAYQLVMSTIQEQSSVWRQGSITSADQTFEQGEGNRAAALIALLSALGFNADLELAAERSNRSPNDDCTAARCYTHPVVRVWTDCAEPMFLDPTISGIAAGALSPEVEGQKAVAVSRIDSTPAETITISSATDQRSVAHAELQLDETGDLRGMIHVRFGSIRGAQVREALRQLSASERKAYLEEIAQKIFPHAREVSGSIINENNPEKSLDLDLKIEAPEFAQWNGSELELGQLVPALGLSKLYATLPSRREDLLLETPLIESSEFVVHLASGMEVRHLPQSVSLKSGFGEYTTKFEPRPGILRIVRSFRIPVQTISPAKYPSFSNFALDIDRAERELILLRRIPEAPTLNSSALLTLH